VSSLASTILKDEDGPPQPDRLKEYRPKIKGIEHVDANLSNLPLVHVAKPSGVFVPSTVCVGGGTDTATDSNKKQKTDVPSPSLRSADQAEAAVQPCQAR
jgi:hypothetical protein